MIFDGINGYVKGTMNLPVGTIYTMIVGPVTGVNKHSGNDASYGIVVTAGASGKYKLQGTNDVSYVSNDDSRVSVSKNLLPTEASVWTDIQAASSSSTSGTFATDYAFIRLVVDTNGTGTILSAYVQWT
jgi:hypothetical protein